MPEIVETYRNPVSTQNACFITSYRTINRVSKSPNKLYFNEPALTVHYPSGAEP